MNTKTRFENILKDATVIANDLEEPQLLYSREQMTEAYNMGIADSAEAAKLLYHEGVSKVNKTVSYFQSGVDNRKHILNLLIK